MAKQGQHKRDIRDSRISRGHNLPKKSQPITTGPYKNPETYRKQAWAHEDPGRKHPPMQIKWKATTRQAPGPQGKIRARHLRSRRSGSDSNASAGTRGY
jgi:hypothetical protein